MLKGRQNGPGRHAHRSGDACSRTFSVSRARSRQQQVTIPLGRTIVAAFGFDFFGFYSGRTERTLMSAKPKYELFADMGRDAFGDKSDALSVKKTRIIDLSEGRACHDLPVRLRRRMALPGRGGRPWPEDREGALPQGAEEGGRSARAISRSR